MSMKKTIAFVASAICASVFADTIEDQVKTCFESQYAEQLRSFTVPYQIEVSGVKPDGEDGFYTADVVMQLSSTSALYKTVIEPKGEATWTSPHIDDDIDDSLISAVQRDEMNAKIQRFLLTDFTVVAPVREDELSSYLKSGARFKIVSDGGDSAKVAGFGNDGKISFSSVRFFELHTAADVANEKVFVSGTDKYERGKKRHLKKRYDIGSACVSINENGGFVKTLRIMETNATAVTDEALSRYTFDVETENLRKLRNKAKTIRNARDGEVQVIRRKHTNTIKSRKVSSVSEVDSEVAVENEMKAVIDKRRQEISVIETEIAKERKRYHNAIRENPGKFAQEPKARFEKAVDNFNALVK